MISIQAPYPLLETTTFLPDPQLSDVQSKLQTVNIKRSKTGRVFSYSKDEVDSRLTYAFDLTRMKSLELQAFVEAYMGSRIKLTNHKNEIWLVYIESNPFEVSQSRRAKGSPGEETDSVSIIFEGVKI